MQLIGFIHGIGNFTPTANEKLKLLETLHAEASKVYGDCRVFYLSYESYLDGLFTSKAVTLAAGAASTVYAGTPYLGKMLADYGDDVLQYYLQPGVRRAISKEIAAQLAIQVGKVGGPVDGITLVGHSLGSLVLLRLMQLVQMTTHSPGNVVAISDKMLDEVLYDPRLADDLVRISQHRIQPVLFGSPAFSRLKGVKGATRSLATGDCAPADVLPNQIRLNEPMFINTLSRQLTHDPLSGTVEDSLPAINITGDWTHANIEAPFIATMNYLKSTLATETEDVA